MNRNVLASRARRRAYLKRRKQTTYVPRRTCLRPRDFENHGYTPGCRACEKLEIPLWSKLWSRNSHTQACRDRVEALIAQSEEGNRRLEETQERLRHGAGTRCEKQHEKGVEESENKDENKDKEARAPEQPADEAKPMEAAGDERVEPEAPRTFWRQRSRAPRGIWACAAANWAKLEMERGRSVGLEIDLDDLFGESMRDQKKQRRACVFL